MEEQEYEDGWREWSKHVLVELKRLDESYQRISDDITLIKVEIAQLKVKSGMWGAIGACIPIGIGILIYLLKSQIAGG